MTRNDDNLPENPAATTVTADMLLILIVVFLGMIIAGLLLVTGG